MPCLKAHIEISKYMNIDEISERLRSAFSGGIYPGPDNVVPQGDDDWEVVWYRQEINKERELVTYLDALNWRGGLKYMTPCAFVYYLPVMMVHSLDLHKPDIAEEVFYALRSIIETEYSHNRAIHILIRLNDGQRCAIVEYLRYFRNNAHYYDELDPNGVVFDFWTLGCPE